MSVPFVFPPQPMRSAEPLSSLLHTRFQSRAKRGRGGKAVSWPPEDQICQIQFFLSNDAPASIASGQAVFQSNHARSSAAQGRHLDGLLDVPPGFHGAVTKRVRIDVAMDVAMSAEMAWCCPPKFIQDLDWLVADGEESEDTEVQKQRELRVLEAFYPRLTSIPDSPGEPAESAECIDDNLVPIIPLLTIEEEDDHSQDAEEEESAADVGSTGLGKPINYQKLQLSRSGSAEPNISSKPWQDPTMAAAAAACLAIHKVGANGLVDQDLLLEILRNPALLKGLTQLNASRDDFTSPMSHDEIGLHGQEVMSARSISKCVEALDKSSHGASMSTGFPSPVSVLQDWSPELLLPKTLANTPANPTISIDPSSSLPLGQSHSSHPSSMNVAHTEPVSATFRGVRALSEESSISSQASSLAHVNRSGAMAASLAPLPSQNTDSYDVSMQVAMDDRPLKRSACVDVRMRGLRHETAALGQHTSKKVMPRWCIYYNTPRGCRNGESCGFGHQVVARQEPMNRVAQ